MKKDIIIIGAGPAGLTAGLYAARAKMNTVIFERFMTGGQIASTMEISNYPGAPEGISGPEFGMRIREQAEAFGAKIMDVEVLRVDFSGELKKVYTSEGEFEAPVVIIAGGTQPRAMGAVGEDKFKGRGISYCATCDAAFFEGLHVYVIGGGDTAVEEAGFISNFARKVTIVHRRDELRAAKSIQEKAFNNPKIDFIWDSVVDEVRGNQRIESFILRNLKTGERREITPEEGDLMFGLFVLVGFVPESKLYEGQVEMIDGYIPTDETMMTNVPGVFAAGDIRVKRVRQVVTATSDGAIAAIEAEKYLEGKK